MILGIDASNIRVGGGITHLSEVLRCARPRDYAFQKIIVWASIKTLTGLCNQPWLEKVHVLDLDGSLIQRIRWQQFIVPKLLKQNRCDLLFSPGGILPRYVSVPTVTMSRNMLPFESKEIKRYKSALMILKFKLLNTIQKMSFQRADGLIFLTQYAKKRVCTQLKRKPRIVIVLHGISKGFFLPPRNQKPFDSYSLAKPYRLLYISNVDVYKHQWHVAEAVATLREKGYPVTIDFVGSFYPQAMRRFKSTMQHIDPNGAFMTYKGFIPNYELPEIYHRADAFVFASSCENMPNILLEAMAAGLPIVCSNRGPMPEILGNANVYFDPERPEEIADVLAIMLNNHTWRTQIAQEAYDRANEYSWEQCAKETFSFLAEVVS